MVELHDSNGDGFEFLCLEQDLFQLRVLDHLVGDDCCKVASFSDVPPVIAVQRRVQVVPQTLHIDMNKRHVRGLSKKT